MTGFDRLFRRFVGLLRSNIDITLTIEESANRDRFVVSTVDEECTTDPIVLDDACAEARIVLDHQIDLNNDIDDKSMRTARIIVVSLSIVAGIGSSRSAADLTNLLNGLMSAGVLLTVLSLVVLVISYFASDPKLGPSSDYVETNILGDGLSRQQYQRELLEAYSVWIDQTGDAIELNGAVLSLGESLFALGILCFMGGLLERVWEVSLLQWLSFL
ncbi:hypothetical protein C447_09672 [Halococcus hamelinensis 100A6]|uniref:Uncharacterized protein n=2 Tax=Halococcus hamelinensis TaxID=332168 RepID=M0LZ25_9EURY|nr:hypothetical protein [Halococcus hamelinensis]EMA38413.1 hypothetical protein C447_09672 [Halococcus hamelinensis 100A6]